MSLMPHRVRRARLLPVSVPFAAIALAGIAAPAAASEHEASLPELLAHAELHAPAVQLAARRRGYAGAARAGAAPLLRQNPTFELGIGPRSSGASGRDLDYFASLGQPVEVAGERGLRLDVAARLGERLDAEATSTRWELRREVVLSYRSAVVARERVAIADRGVRFAGEMLGIARRRLAAGDATAIEVRVAATDLAQARQAKLSAEQDLRAARVRLAEVTGWAIEAPPSVPAGLEAPRAVPPLSAVMEAAQERHPELRARRAAVAEARARVALADREAWPAPVLGVEVAREGSADGPASHIVLGTLEVPLPFWQLNQAERARSRVDEEVARAEESATSRALRARIARAHAELASASERLLIFTSGVAPQLEDSLSLLRRGFDAGELPLLDVAVARERFLAAQRDALTAYADYYRALAELEFAAGAELPAASPAPATGGVP